MSEITHVRPTGGDPASDVSLLLGLEGLAVTQVEIDECSGARVVHVLTADEGAAACPSCGVFSTAGKGWVQTRPRDIPYRTGALRLGWRKRRWRCSEVVCERGSFTEATHTLDEVVTILGSSADCSFALLVTFAVRPLLRPFAGSP